MKSVEKPGRYSGGEYNQIIKDKEKIKARWAFCFPDSYEIGMSNLGMRILYGTLNKEEDIWCERVFTPWADMQEQMKKYNIPLTAHESKDPLTAFDIVGFTLQCFRFGQDLRRSYMIKYLFKIPISTQFEFGWEIIYRFWLSFLKPIARSPLSILIRIYIQS